jgi:hypothetical protein
MMNSKQVDEANQSQLKLVFIVLAPTTVFVYRGHLVTVRLIESKLGQTLV